MNKCELNWNQLFTITRNDLAATTFLLFIYLFCVGKVTVRRILRLGDLMSPEWNSFSAHTYTLGSYCFFCEKFLNCVSFPIALTKSKFNWISQLYWMTFYGVCGSNINNIQARRTRCTFSERSRTQCSITLKIKTETKWNEYDMHVKHLFNIMYVWIEYR